VPGFPVIRYCKEIQKKKVLQIKVAAIPQGSFQSTCLICSLCITLGRHVTPLIQEFSLRRRINEQNCQSYPRNKNPNCFFKFWPVSKKKIQWPKCGWSLQCLPQLCLCVVKVQ